MENYNCLNYMTEDGEVISKEDFLAEAGRLYEEMTKSVEEEEKPYNFFKELLAISSQVQETNILETFSFCRREIYITQEMYDICSSLDFDDYLNDDCSEDQVLIKYFYKDENGEQKKIKTKGKVLHSYNEYYFSWE